MHADRSLAMSAYVSRLGATETLANRPVVTFSGPMQIEDQ